VADPSGIDPARRQRRRDALLIGAALAVLAAALVTQGWAWRVERVLYDLGLALSPREVPADVVIVAIDEPSVAAIGRWPWRRAVHTTLLERLAAAKPRAVMLDLVLSEPDPDPRQDMLLAQALRAAAPVVVPVAWYALPGERPRLLEPAGPLRDAARPVQAEVEPDRDGLLRHTFLRAGLGSASLPHAALALLEAGGESLPPGLAVERHPAPASATPGWVRDERLPIRFQGPAGHLKRVSYVDVLTGAVPPEALAGRYVLVGMTAAGLGDAHATPVAAPMQGIEVIGQTLQALRRGDMLRSPPAWATALGSALAVLLLLTAFGRMNPRYALALSFGLAVAALAGSVVLVGLGWWITPAGFVAGAALAYPLWSWRRLEVTAAALDEEIARLYADTSLGAVPERELADDRRLTAFSEAAARLRSARRFLAASLDGLPEAVLLADAQGRVTLANRRAAALFEVGEASELAGLSLAELLGELTRADAVDWPARLRSVAEQGGVLAVQSQLADHGDLLVSVARAPDADGPRLIATCADISEIKTAERAREEALAFVSHDLRSPLASIALMADFHRAGAQPLPLDQMVAEMQRLARRGLELSESFVRAAQAHAKPLELEPGDLAELLTEVVRDLAPQVSARAMTFAFDPSPLGAAASHFDRELLGRALGNLVGNAIKYAPQGSTITLGLQVREGGHLFTVQDQGPGLEAEQVARLFRAYSRVGASAAQAGVGLGLQFVQRVAERHGGWVQAHSTPGHGARFELFVPVGRS
jgi:CHASE2 domain-containing sensor protein/signal transduction histidine kinase